MYNIVHTPTLSSNTIAQEGIGTPMHETSYRSIWHSYTKQHANSSH